MLNDLRSVFQKELGPGELILWSGQPRQGIMLHPLDAIMLPLSLIVSGCSLLPLIWAINSRDLFLIISSTPLILLVLYFTVGRYIVDAKRREKTYYAVTNERIIIISGILNRTVRILTLRTISDISLQTKKDGSGTIVLGPHIGFYYGFAWPGIERFYAPAFENIRNVREVYELIRKTQVEVAH